MAARNKFSLCEHIFLLTNYYRFDSYYSEIFGELEQSFPNRPLPTRNYVYKLHHKFQTTGTVDNAPRSGRPRTTQTENTQLVAEAFMEQPIRSAKRVSLLFDFSNRSLPRLMKDLNYTNTSLLSCFCCWHCLLSIVVYFPLSFFASVLSFFYLL